MPFIASVAPTAPASLEPSPVSTFASRNPDRPVIAPKERAVQSNAQKVQDSGNRAIRREAKVAFQADLEDFLAERDAQIIVLARKYNKKPAAVKKLILHSSHYKTRRAPSLRNAKICYMRKKMNKGMFSHPNIPFSFLLLVIRQTYWSEAQAQGASSPCRRRHRSSKSYQRARKGAFRRRGG